MAAGMPRKPGAVAADGSAGALADGIGLGIGLGLAVVERADDHGAVDIAVDKIEQNLLTDARQTVAPPIGAGGGSQISQDPHPRAGAVVSRGAAVTRAGSR